MRTKNILMVVLVVVTLVIIYYSFSGNENSETYVANIQKMREEKDNDMRTASDSPFVNDTTHTFQGLQYFPIDAAFMVQARLTPIEQKKSVTLPTSDGKEKSYLEYAYAEF